MQPGGRLHGSAVLVPAGCHHGRQLGCPGVVAGDRGMGERFLGMEEMANAEQSRGSRWPCGCGGKRKKLFLASCAPGAWTLHEIKRRCLLGLRRAESVFLVPSHPWPGSHCHAAHRCYAALVDEAGPWVPPRHEPVDWKKAKAALECATS